VNKYLVIPFAALHANRKLIIFLVMLYILLAFAYVAAYQSQEMILFLALLILLPIYLLKLVIYGRIYEYVGHGSISSNYSTLLQNHILNYTIVWILLLLLTYAIDYLMPTAQTTMNNDVLLVPAIHTIFNIITAYILPLVFIKRIGLTALPAGVLYFFYAISASKPLIVSFLLVYLAQAIGAYTFMNMDSSLVSGHFLPFLIGILSSIFSIYFDFFIFAQATQILLSGKSSYQTD